MDKMKLAHDWAISVINGNTRAVDAIDFVERAWAYADAMQAEAEKREDKTRPDVLFDVERPYGF